MKRPLGNGSICGTLQIFTTLFLKGEVIWMGGGEGQEWVTKIADDTKLFRILRRETDFGDLQNYFMVLSDRAISEKADKQYKRLISTEQHA